MTKYIIRTLFLYLLLTLFLVLTSRAQSTTAPLSRLVDLNIGETQRVTLYDESTVQVKLVDVVIEREVAGSIYAAHVTVEVNGEEATLGVGTYNLPVTVGGVQIDSPVVNAYIVDATSNYWALERDARLRLWPADAPWIRPNTFGYPLGQRFLASATHFSNEPAGYRPGGVFYYHAGLDFGGAERMDTIYATTDGLVISARGEIIDTHRDPVVSKLGAGRGPREDVIYVQDGRGWYHRYSHLDTLFASVRMGEQVKLGQPIALMGKRGSSGGYSHLHYEISSPMPSGGWGTQHAYPFVWQAYQREYDPAVIAVGRPHHTVQPGGTVILDARHSWAKSKIASYHWTFSDSTTATGPTVERTYQEPGVYSEILKVTDQEGNVDFDFARVAVPFPQWSSGIGGGLPDWKVQRGLKEPGIHAAFYPTRNIEAGEEVTFLVRARGTTWGEDVWHFGDGSLPDTTRSNTSQDYHPDINQGGYATTTHRFEKPGHYIVTVQRRNRFGTAMIRLHVAVGMEE